MYKNIWNITLDLGTKFQSATLSYTIYHVKLITSFRSFN